MNDIGTASRQSPADDLCWANQYLTTFYAGTNYTGTSYALPEGVWDYDSLAANIGGDNIESMQSPAGYYTTLYSEQNCWGSSGVGSLSTSTFGTMNNQASCLRIDPSVTLYANQNYGGTGVTVPQGGTNHTGFGALGNDNAESLKAAPGVVARVCPETGYPGTVGWGSTCTEFSGNVTTLGGLNNNVSNVEVFPGVTVYQSPDYSGGSQTFKVGTYTSSALSVVGNDAISSLVAAPGIRVTACSEATGPGSGYCKEFTGWNSWLGAASGGFGMNDQISYLKVEMDQTYGYAGSVFYSTAYADSSWGPRKAIDGNPNSVPGSYGFTTALGNHSNHTEWVTVVLPSIRTFSKVVLYPRNDVPYVGEAFPVDFQIQVWDGSNWLTRVTKTGYSKPGNQGQEFTWGSSDTTNQIRINATSLRLFQGDYLMQFAEIAVY